MTRFARSRGSKASNERAPEDSTPWEVMREQLLQAKQQNEDAKKRQEAEDKRVENYENFLKEQKVQKRKATWCDFPEEEGRANQLIEPPSKKKKKQKSKNQLDPVISKSIRDNVEKNNEKLENKSKKKNKFKQKMVNELQIDNVNFEPTMHENNGATGDDDTNVKLETKSKKKRKNKQKIDNVHSETLANQTTESVNVANDGGNSINIKKKSKKKKKNKQKILPTENSLMQSEPQIENKDTSEVADQRSGKKKKNKKKPKRAAELTFSNQKHTDGDDGETTNEVTSSNPNITKNQDKGKAKKKKKKLVNGKPVRRKEINDHSFQLIINGKEVELVRFDGFPVMKKDADRLQELKNNMIKKGIPKSEVQRTMQLERRRAEKALARVKRDVCYNCRKGGHNLSDCPDLKSKIPGVDAAEGVCFKCGSTEHRQFECKVQRDKEFRFATCFICKEQGHIARQCPDNAKGLYPNGGCCKLCGDVTHLRKDCPTVKDKKEVSSVKLQTLESAENIEDIGVQTTTSAAVEFSKKPKKIKF